MANLSTGARISLVAMLLLGVVAYLIVVDLGANAGLVHYGVRVGHVNVGGMTEIEARRAIEDAGTQMLEAPIAFTADGLPMYRWLPDDIGWDPRPTEMAARAMKVGRREGLGRSIGDRVAAWVAGVKVRWSRPNPRKVLEQIEEIDADAALLGLEVNRPKLRYLIRKASRSWPRAPYYEIPMR